MQVLQPRCTSNTYANLQKRFRRFTPAPIHLIKKLNAQCNTL